MRRPGACLAVVVAAVLVAGCGSSDVSRAVGARCDDSSECDDRCLLPEDDWPGGFCTLSCDASDDCPDDAACVEDEGGACLFRCDLAADCGFLGTGWRCNARPARPADGGTEMVCVPS